MGVGNYYHVVFHLMFAGVMGGRGAGRSVSVHQAAQNASLCRTLTVLEVLLTTLQLKLAQTVGACMGVSILLLF